MRKIIKWTCAAASLCLFAAGGFTAGISYQRRNLSAVQTSSVEDHDPIGTFVTERQQLRQMQLSQLNEIIHSEDTQPELIALAQQRRMELLKWSEQELTLEGVLKMRGFDDAVVTVHADSVNVLVRRESVSSREAAVILELVTRETGCSGGNVKIIPIN